MPHQATESFNKAVRWLGLGLGFVLACYLNYVSHLTTLFAQGGSPVTAAQAV